MPKKVLLFAGIFALFAAGCNGLLPLIKEKEPTVELSKSEYSRLLDEKAALEDRVGAMVNGSEYNRLLKEKAALEKKLKASEEKIDLLQREEAGEKIILLFDGKIKYSVEAAAVMDYEELLVLNMLSDQEFEEAMDMGGKQTDLALIGLLKKITRDDRRITKEEIQAYLESKKR